MKSISFVIIYFIWLDKINIHSIYFVNDLKRIKQIYNDIYFYKIKRRYIDKGTKQGNKKRRKGFSKSRIRIRIGRCGSEDPEPHRLDADPKQ